MSDSSLSGVHTPVRVSSHRPSRKNLYLQEVQCKLHGDSSIDREQCDRKIYNRDKMTDKPILLLDMDGIIADFNFHSIRTYNEIHGSELDPKKCNDYIGDHEVLEKSIDPKALRRPYREPGFFLGCPVIPGAQEGVERLGQAFEIYVLTTHYWGNPTCVYEKELWLQRHFPKIAQRGIFTSHKELVPGNLFIDDRPKNIKAWKDKWGGGSAYRTASLDYSWTDHTILNYYASTWKKLADQILEDYVDAKA